MMRTCSMLSRYFCSDDEKVIARSYQSFGHEVFAVVSLSYICSILGILFADRPVISPDVGETFRFVGAFPSL